MITISGFVSTFCSIPILKEGSVTDNPYLHGIDIRNYGSGNAGTTNALRTLGKKAGAMTLIGDMLK